MDTTTTAPLSDRIADLFAVPDELREHYDAISEDDVLTTIGILGADSDPDYGNRVGRQLARLLVAQELDKPEPPRMASEKDGSFERDLEHYEQRTAAIERELRRSGAPFRFAAHERRLLEASWALQGAQARAESDAASRQIDTDPVTGVYDPDVHGAVDHRSVLLAGSVDAAVTRWGEPRWDVLKASALTHHLASVLFAERVLEARPDLGEAVEAEVQRMIERSGLTGQSPTAKASRLWLKR